jgi:hypothetical protein
MLSYHSSATNVTSVETLTASTTAVHESQGTPSREQPNGDNDPFPVQEATEHVAYPFHPAILVPE